MSYEDETREVTPARGSRGAVLSKSTQITLGLGIVLAGAIWWASAIDSKLSIVVDSLTQFRTKADANAIEISDLKARVKVLEAEAGKR